MKLGCQYRALQRVVASILVQTRNRSQRSKGMKQTAQTEDFIMSASYVGAYCMLGRGVADGRFRHPHP